MPNPVTDEHTLAAFFHDRAESHTHTEASENAPCPLVKVDWIRGVYLDDKLNTDQAWKEAKVVHIHYETKESLEEYFQESLKWLMISEYTLTKLSAGESNILQRFTMNLKIDII